LIGGLRPPATVDQQRAAVRHRDYRRISLADVEKVDPQLPFSNSVAKWVQDHNDD
jgi:hypothetical protein